MANIVNPYDSKIMMNGSSTYYIIDYAKLQSIQKYLMTANFLDNIKLLFDNANQYVISCKIYPFSPTRFVTTSEKEVIVGNGVYIKNNLDQNIRAHYITSNTWGKLKIATINFSEYFNSFLDYEPYTKIQIFLPYYDFVDIDVNLYMNKTLDIYFEVDFTNGTCMYAFVVNGNMIESFSGKVGIDIPLSQANGSEIARNDLLMMLNTSKSLVGVSADYSYKSGLKSTSKNIGTYITATGLEIGIGSVVDFVNSNQKKFSKQSQPSGFLDFTKPQKVYMIISRPNIQRPSNYNHTIGRPSGKTNYLYDLKGFTIVDEIHLDGFAYATQSELNEIETLLKSGVIL